MPCVPLFGSQTRFLLGVKIFSIPFDQSRVLIFSVNPAQEDKEYFRDLVYGNIVVRHDRINLMMEAKKGQLTHSADSKTDNKEHYDFATVEESEVGRSNNISGKFQGENISVLKISPVLV